MERFHTLTATAAPLMVPNIDTDTIIPVVWLRSLGADQAKGLFARWRLDAGGRERPDFILNREPYRNSRILLAGRNFGCGSSRENAVWALMAFGIRCVIAPSFGDIFAENAAKNGLLTAAVPEPEVERLAAAVEQSQGAAALTVDLEACTVTGPDAPAIPFSISPAVRGMLLEGLDEIARTLRAEGSIQAYQEKDRVHRPWIYASVEPR